MVKKQGHYRKHRKKLLALLISLPFIIYASKILAIVFIEDLAVYKMGVLGVSLPYVIIFIIIFAISAHWLLIDSKLLSLKKLKKILQK